jgi:RluA family pseudouridine synthase
LADRILYAEGGWLVVDKPAGVPSTGRTRDDADALEYWLAKHARRTVWAVHQLDATTSGVNVFVTRRSMVAEVKQRMSGRNAHKDYLTLVDGVFEEDEHVVDAPLGRQPTPEDPGRQGVTPDGRPSRTRMRVLARGTDRTLVRARIESGRTHQVRVHLAHLGHPIVGDVRYGGPTAQADRALLHAWRLRFRDGDPPGGFEAIPAGDLAVECSRVGIDFGAVLRTAGSFRTGALER